MTPNHIISSLNSSFLGGSSTIEDHDHQFHHQLFSPSFQPQPDASSSSHSFNFYFNPTQDQAGYNYHGSELVNQPQHQFDQGNNESVAFGGSYDYFHKVENKVGKGLKISHGSKKEGKHEINVGDQEANNNYGKNNSSKVRMMLKMKKSDHKKGGEKEDSQKMSFNNNNDHGSNYCSLYNSNTTPIRVCSDCNTTKTPLWRSGPKGPKSLCNACGIRQRKARRALAVAAAAAAASETTNNGTPLSSSETTPSPTTTITKVKIIKVNNQKEKSSTKNNNNNYCINGLSTVPFKKRCRETTTNASSSAVGSSSSDDQEPPAAAPVDGFEDFLINVKKKLGFQHVFPQDEKEAAILLMALSCGLVHG